MNAIFKMFKNINKNVMSGYKFFKRNSSLEFSYFLPFIT